MATQLGIPSIQSLPRFLPKCRSNRRKIGLRIRSELGKEEGNTLMGQALLTSGVLKGNLLKFIPCMDTAGRQKIQSSAIQWALTHNPQLMFSGFGFSDKPQPKYGFDYTLDDYTSAFESLIEAIAPDKLSLVIQITDKHATLPSTLALFNNFLLGEIFSQDPLRASDKALTSCGPYAMKEEVAMVYRRPYLTSGSSGFALNAISKAMKKDLKAYVQSMREVLLSESWKVPTSICLLGHERPLAQLRGS